MLTFAELKAYLDSGIPFRLVVTVDRRTEYLETVLVMNDSKDAAMRQHSSISVFTLSAYLMYCIAQQRYDKVLELFNLIKEIHVDRQSVVADVALLFWQDPLTHEIKMRTSAEVLNTFNKEILTEFGYHVETVLEAGHTRITATKQMEG